MEIPRFPVRNSNHVHIEKRIGVPSQSACPPCRTGENPPANLFRIFRLVRFRNLDLHVAAIPCALRTVWAPHREHQMNWPVCHTVCSRKLTRCDRLSAARLAIGWLRHQPLAVCSMAAANFMQRLQAKPLPSGAQSCVNLARRSGSLCGRSCQPPHAS